MVAITLDLRVGLPLVRAAFDAGTLQIQTMPSGSCSYVGPCGIGAMVSPTYRAALDAADSDLTIYDMLGVELETDEGEVYYPGSTSFLDLLEAGVFICPYAQITDLAQFQKTHDAGDIPAFSAFLAQLEQKYPPHAV